MVKKPLQGLSLEGKSHGQKSSNQVLTPLDTPQKRTFHAYAEHQLFYTQTSKPIKVDCVGPPEA